MDARGNLSFKIETSPLPLYTDKSLLDVIIEQQLRWLGHLSRMEKNRLPKRVLFGELEKKRPFHGTKRRWRDVVKVDVEAIRVGEGWYKSYQDRINGVRSVVKVL